MKAKVLVVEDSAAQRQRLAELLVKRGYDVRAASGGLEALRIIKTDPPDVVLLDVMLDGMDGYSVCRWMRLGEATRDIVVIMLTVKTEVKERVEGLNVGADDYMPKPYDDEELEARMFAALRTRTARLELRQRNVELESMLTKTERLAMTDPLTGVYNRRRFVDVLRRELATSRRYMHALSVVLLDVDKFKAINDTDGHPAGDEALKRVAEILTNSIREVDVCARYGGDEFALLLPHTPPERASTVMDRVQKRVHAERETWPGEARFISLSAGISSNLDGGLKSAEDLIEAADRGLYDAKRAGRDRYVFAPVGVLG